MTRDVSLIVPACLCAALFAASFVGGEGAVWIFILSAGTAPSLLALVGSARRRRVGIRTSGALTTGLGVLALWLVSCLAGLWILRGEEAGPLPWPTPLVLLVLGLCLMPLIFVVILYARTFETDGISETDLADLRRRFPRREP